MYRRQLCFYHWRLHQPSAPVNDVAYVPPVFDSEASLVIASSHLFRAVLAGKIDLRRAQVALSCLRQAAKSLRLQHPVGDHAETAFTPFMADYFTNLQRAQSASSAAYPDPQPLIYPASTGTIVETGTEGENVGTGASPVQRSGAPQPTTTDHAPAGATDSAPKRPLSPAQTKLLKKILRRGPSHPQFQHATRLLDRHIAATSADNHGNLVSCPA